MSESTDKLLKSWLFKFEDINFGIVLVGIYVLLELGSVQGLFPILNSIKIPFLVSLLTYLYAFYLVISGNIDFSSNTTKSFTVLCLFIIVYALLATGFPDKKIDLLKIFLLYLSNYYVLVYSLKKPSQYILFMDIFLFAVLFSSYHGIMQGGKIYGNRWLKDENHISLVAAMAIPYAFMLFRLYRSYIKKAFYAFCLLGYVTVNVVAASRGGALSMILVGFFCWLFTDKKIRNTVIVLIAVIGVLLYAPPVFFEEMSTLEQGTEEGTAADRIYLWGVAMDMFASHPILGVGPMNYGYYFSDYEKGVKYPLGVNRVAHSTPVQWLAELGIVGSIILLIVFRFMFKNWRYTRFKRKASLDDKQELNLFSLLTHANAISQVGFWFGSMFLTLMPYPFYWILIPFSESWKNIFQTEISNNEHEY